MICGLFVYPHDVHGFGGMEKELLKMGKCNVCIRHPKRYAEGGTTHQIEHLKSHQVTEQGPMPSIASISAIQKALATTTPRLNFNIDTFKQVLIQCMIDSHISFRLTTPFIFMFNFFFSYCNSTLLLVIGYHIFILCKYTLLLIYSHLLIIFHF